MGLFDGENIGGKIKSGDYKVNADISIHYNNNYIEKANIHIYTHGYNSWTGHYGGEIITLAKYSPDQIKYYKVLSQTQEQSYSKSKGLIGTLLFGSGGAAAGVNGNSSTKYLVGIEFTDGKRVVCEISQAAYENLVAMSPQW